MTQPEAQKVAVQRWGPHAIAEAVMGLDRPLYRVLCGHRILEKPTIKFLCFTMSSCVRECDRHFGVGESFDEAFAAANYRERHGSGGAA